MVLDLSALVKPEHIAASIDIKNLKTLAEAKGVSPAEIFASSGAFVAALDASIVSLSQYFKEKVAVIQQADRDEVQSLTDFAYFNYAAIISLLRLHQSATGVDAARFCLLKLRDLEFFQSDIFLRVRSDLDVRAITSLEASIGSPEWPWPSPSILPKDIICLRIKLTEVTSALSILSSIAWINAINALRTAGGNDGTVSVDKSDLRVSITLGQGIEGTFGALKHFQDAAYGAGAISCSFEVTASAQPTHVATILCESGVTPEFWSLFNDLLQHAKLSCLSASSLSSSTAFAYEVGLTAAGDLPADLNARILSIGVKTHVDIVVQDVSVFRTRKRVVIFDMDSTLIQQEVIDELAREAGVVAEVSRITEAAMNGEIDFKESLRRRVGLLKGTPTSVLEKVRSRITFSPGAHELCRALKRLGYKLAVISGGFIPLARYVKAELGLDYAFANELKVSPDGLVLEGVTEGPVVDGVRKAELLEVIAHAEGVKKDQVIAVGDGANDLLMMAASGLGVAYNAKPRVQEQAKARINQKSLAWILYILGLKEYEISVLTRP